MSARKRAEVVPHPSDPTLALVPLTQGKWAVIDAAYADRVSAFVWSARRCSKTYYACRNSDPITGKRGYASLHRFIATLAGMDMSGLIDHKNGNGLDCREENLRPATKSTNAQNRGLDRSNRSGVKGVHFEAFTGRYRAEIWAAGRHIRLGRFDTLAEAETAITDARREYHGEFANDGKAVLQ